MAYGPSHVGRTQKEEEELELDLDSPIGEKPWPLSYTIKSILKQVWGGYMWVCTVFTSIFVLYTYVKWVVG